MLKTLADGIGMKTSSWFVPLALATLLIIISSFNFLLFHTFAELFAIIIAILICVVGWQMFPYTRNHFLMYLGCGYFWIAILDLMHTLTYKGLSIIPITGANVGTQFWIGTRYIEAFLLLSAPWFLNHKLNRNLTFSAFGLLSAILLSLIILGYFPDTYIEGHGLTRFKIISEYTIIAMLSIAIVVFLRQQDLPNKGITHIVIASIILTMFAELSFTFYLSVYDLSNIVGHIFKLFSYWLIFMAIVRTTLSEPFETMFKGASTYDAIPDATIVIDQKGIIQQVNNRACELAGMPRTELLGKYDHEVYHPADLKPENCPVCQAVGNEQPLDSLELSTQNGEKKYFSFSLSELRGISGGHTTVEVIRDITIKKKTEEQITSLSALKDSIVDNLPLTLFVKDAKDLRYVEWNKTAEQLTGFSKNDMLGKNDYDLWPEHEAEFFISKDREVLNNGKLIDIPEETISTKSGVRTLHTKKIPIYNHKGEASFLLGISEDITDKRQIDLALHQSQKMDAIGKLTGGIAHDFNNMLGVVLGFSELIKLKLDNDDPKLIKYVDEIYHAGERAKQLTSKLLAFSRKGSAEEADIVVLNDFIQSMRQMLETTLTPRIKVIFELGDNVWPVFLDQTRLEDSILNIAINAMHAIPENGSLTLTTKNSELDERDVNGLEIEAGDYVLLTISDSGVGMDRETQQKMFDPFFTTKGNEGTGLGLSQVYGFVKQAGGAIQVFSEPGYGTTIVIYLPRMEDEMLARWDNEDISTRVLPMGTETILVVDDEVALLELAIEILENQGYTVFKAQSAEEALELLKQQHVDLLFSDVIMPGMNGYQLATEVEKLYPNIKIQMASGYTDDLSLGLSNSVLHENRLNKPVSAKELLIRIRHLLDE